ncbi:YALI0E19074p [Yarrowia lipolytica CLIB122]|uniref:Cytosolic Fe-S cluster assembly factor CFD1 n=2 Tax=Yarrowia lipolytica TaxID=4952 RepID=CFD1_YARLI|nr:YALI0E19074p [Yarrowia lipolytica CLIB122]Q6C5D0.1 RecName: Full=Cytosolic Fe-S cluster assembly factor CFD1; AltName: Full=Cytosolic Fe-S cluster-deficient protein 1 [Yarrowia lipolytica CLIB122]KAJ8057108.1 cytosolic Fe-S cluster assembly factor CFD1 [Yarrowia lipolytica]CAG79727.1 YALI0E19074p [Yarrowia lipolytica CLIB122]SEI35772.1 YALIA101S08e03114g1_1 [Yarrowia lipolytica]VBB78402.1 Iron-sulfur cluster binding protein, putative [Yarrowia lipolytica]|eukprot:XP_504132.1 YALI0E19074p [Yarrowia lipolytica CLIB122]
MYSTATQSSPSLAGVKNIVLVLSGKGGVGKSSVTTQLALTLAAQGKKVGVLDIDLTGPSIPRFFGMEDKQVYQSSAGWVPVYTDASRNLCLMSLGFLLSSRGDSVVWRGPRKTAMIRQFIRDVVWGELDYLLIDTPPGTSDEHISIAEELRFCDQILGAVIVTTPQGVALADVRKELSFCKKIGFPILGIIENMSGYVCPHCSECQNIFSKGGGENLAKQYECKFLGTVPIDPKFVLMVENAKGGLQEIYGETDMAKIFAGICDKAFSEENEEEAKETAEEEKSRAATNGQ